MAFTHTIVKNWSDSSNRSISSSIAYSATQQASVDESVPDSSTDLQINVTIDVSALVVIYLLSDKDVTIETNSGSTPDDTIVLKANKPYIWGNDGDTFDAASVTQKLSVDVTAFFVTNASGAAAQIKCEVLQDATP